MGIGVYDILKALSNIDQYPDLKIGRESTDYDLIYHGTSYPPILVLSEANQNIGLGKLTLSDFNNNTNKAFKILRDLGFQVVKKQRPDDINLGLKEQREFLTEWPIERINSITLEDYTNLDKDSAFIYWIEQKTDHAGSIVGGSAYKFGIYKRADTTSTIDSNAHASDGEYAWYRYLGENRDDVWNKVKNIIIRIADYSINDNFESIDDIEFSFGVKWKIAYHYNPEKIIPIFKEDVLKNAAKSLGLLEENPRVWQLHQFLLSKKPDDITTLEYALNIFRKYSTNNFLYVIEKFLKQSQTNDLKRKRYPRFYKELNVKVSFGAGNIANVPWIALLDENNKVTQGIYPVFLYYKEYNLLILAYGVSETNAPSTNWPNTEGMQSISDWFIDNLGSTPFRYGSSFIKNVYRLDDEDALNSVQNDLDDIIDHYKSLNQSIRIQERKYWLIAPGENARLWNDFINNKIVAIGWDEIGNLEQYSSQDDIRHALIDVYIDENTTRSNNSLALWEFAHVMSEGDIIISQKGKKEYLGYGIITSKYIYNDSRAEYKHTRNINWEKTGSWPDEVGPIPLKTLTNITKNSTQVERITKLMGIEQPEEISESINYWWLNANPKFWSITDFEVGQEQTYTSINDKGNKRKKYEYFKSIKSGDLIIGYETSPIKKVVAIMEITQGLHEDEDEGQVITFTIQRFLPEPIPWEELVKIEELANCEIIKSNQGSLFKLTKTRVQCYN